MSSTNLEIDKLLLTPAALNFQGLFVNEFDSWSSWFEEKKLVFEEIYHKKFPRKKMREAFLFPLSCKNG